MDEIKRAASYYTGRTGELLIDVAIALLIFSLPVVLLSI